MPDGLRHRIGAYFARRTFAKGILQSGMRIHNLKISGIHLQLADEPDSAAAVVVGRELDRDCYRISDIDFRQDDVVLDIGAHVGGFSCYLAKRYPFLRILAFEPTPASFHHLVYNLAANGIHNVMAYNTAVTGDGRALTMTYHDGNTGGATAQLADLRLPDHRVYEVESRTLDSIFEDLRVERCRLLKIDCEGSEHEILLRSIYLPRIQHLRGEFHVNGHLAAKGYSVEALIAHCSRHIPRRNIHVESIRMAE